MKYGWKILTLTVLSFLLCGLMVVAQTPAPTPPPTVGIKGTNEVSLGIKDMVFTDTSNRQLSYDASNLSLKAEYLHWFSDHFAGGVSVYHDTLVLAPYFPNLPKPQHNIWGMDLPLVYTLKTWSGAFDPGLPPEWVAWLNANGHASIASYGGIGVIHIDQGQTTFTYFLGVVTQYAFAPNYGVKLITDVRHLQLFGVNKTVPEVTAQVYYRF